ncbi:efflux RND transporter permease subunit [Lacibacterium aquatile]|uniref:Efflux RND transporter permease subunit n=1 Tax=Lacibacterium aquatile TaxID=1168082 RepID=A0ABW5DU75_9PROT
MNLSELCIRRPVMTTLMMAAIILAGIAGFRQLPVSALPKVDFPTIVVFATLSGASPEVMANSVATPLEREFSNISGITSMTSTSTQGSTNIVLEFDLNRNIDQAALDVQAALSVAQRRLPKEMTSPPGFRKQNPSDDAILLIALSSPTLPLSQVHEYAETVIGQRLSTITGVSEVSIFGGQKFAVRIQVDPQALAAHNVPISEVQDALASATSTTPLGTLNGPAQTMTLQTTGEPRAAKDFKNLIVAYRNGAPVRLTDIAQVQDSVQNDKIASWYNGVRSITLAIKRQPAANTVEVVDKIKELLPAFRAQVPPSINIDVLNDRSVSIRDSIADVEFTFVLTVILVVLTIFLFLRKFSATVIPSLALPMSIVGTFAGMYLCGFSLNNISLMALTLAVGFVVDDAIVMLENIVRHIEDGMKPYEAAIKGSKEIGFTIISITLSLISVFIPILFMGGVIGRIFFEFAVTISLAILVSGFISLTLTPMLCSRFLSAHQGHQKEGIFGRILEGGFQGMLWSYRVTLRGVMKMKFVALMATLALTAVTIVEFQRMPRGFFPEEDNSMLSIFTEANQDTSFPAMAERQQKLAAIVAGDPDVISVNSVAGGFGSRGQNTGQMFVEVKRKDLRSTKNLPIQDIVGRLRSQLNQVPGINAYVNVVQNLRLGGRQSNLQYQYTLQGLDQAELFAWIPRIEQGMRQIPGVADVSSDLRIRSPQAVVDIDYDRASALGLSTDTIRSTLYSFFGTRQVSTIFTSSNDYPVILEVERKFQEDPAGLGKVYVRSDNGTLVPMETFATVRRAVGPLSVNHQGQLASVTVSFALQPGIALGNVTDQIHKLETDLGLPATISSSFAGSAKVFQDATSNQVALIGVAILAVYIILGVLYESFIHPITILSGLPAAGLGALLTLKVFGMDLSIIAAIGIVMLIGIVKKNAIMMIDFALERKQAGETDAEKAIVEACLIRFRPIMMTTFAAILGVLPIAVGHGAGAELRQPLGISVVGGLIVSQLLTLYITPVIYVYFEKLAAFLKRKPEAEGPTMVPPPAGQAAE